MRLSALMCRAQLSWRSPPRLSRWRLIWPLEAWTGLTPARAAKVLPLGACAWEREAFAGQEPAGGLLGVDQVVLVVAAAPLGPLAFVDGEPVREQRPRQRGAVAARALEHEGRLPERARKPPQ